MESKENFAIQEIGNYERCVAVIGNEMNVPKLLKLVRIVDRKLGVTPMCTTDELLARAVEVDSQILSALSGYSHLVTAERMHAQGFDRDAINREIDKAEAMLSHANLGGNSPWLPRAQKLKRKVNLRSYVGLGFAIVALLALLLVAGAAYRFAVDEDINIL